MIIESGLVKAGLVKTGLVRAISNINTRYFRRNEGTTDYATIPEVTLAGDFVIEFDSLVLDASIPNIVLGSSASTNNGVFINSNNITVRDNGGDQSFTTGSPFSSSVFNSVRVEKVSLTIRIFVNGIEYGSGASNNSFIFNQVYTRQNGNFNLAGILANLKIWDNGTLIRDYPLNDNSDDLRELANGQNGTVINGNALDWGLFQQQATGEWLGQELVVNGGFDTDSDWTLNGTTITDGRLIFGLSTTSAEQTVLPVGPLLRFEFNIDTYNGASIGVSSTTLGASNLFTSGGVKTFDDNAVSARFVFVSTGSNANSIDNASVKEVLNVS